MSFSTQPFPNSYSDQRSFLADLETGLSELERLVYQPTVHKATQPSQDELEAAWLELFAAPMPVFGRVQWYNTNKSRIDNIFMRDDDALTTMVPILSKDESGSGIFFVDSSYLDASAASISISNIPQTYKDLLVLVCTRSTAAGPVNHLVRLNAVATGYHYAQQVAGLSTHTASEGINQTGVAISTPGTATDPTQYTYATMYIRDYANAARLPHGWLLYTVYAGNPINIQNVVPNTWVLNNAQAINAISLVPASGSVEKDSYIAVFGLK